MMDANSENHIIDWIFSHTKVKLSKPICEQLKSGVVLCKLINSFKPNTIKKINVSVGVFAQRENIGNFINGCSTIGLNEDLSRFQDSLLGDKDSVLFNILYNLMKLSERSQSPIPNTPQTANAGSTPGSPNVTRPIQPISKRPPPPSSIPPSLNNNSRSGSNENLATHNSGSSTSITKPMLSMLSNSTPKPGTTQLSKSRIFGNSPPTSSPSLSSSGNTPPPINSLPETMSINTTITSQNNNDIISPRKKPPMTRSNTVSSPNDINNLNNNSNSNSNSNHNGNNIPPFISRGPQSSSFNDLTNVPIASLNNNNNNNNNNEDSEEEPNSDLVTSRKPAPPLPPRFKLPSKENSSPDLNSFIDDNSSNSSSFNNNISDNDINSNNVENDNVVQNNNSPTSLTPNNSEDLVSSPPLNGSAINNLKSGGTFKQPPVSQSVPIPNSFNTVSTPTPTNQFVSIIPNGNSSIFNPPQSSVQFSTSPPLSSPFQQYNTAQPNNSTKKPRSTTKQKLEKFFSKSKLNTPKSPNSNTPQPSSPIMNSSSTSDDSINLLTSSTENASGLTQSSGNYRGATYRNNSNNNLPTIMGGPTDLINSIGSQDGFSENGSESEDSPHNTMTDTDITQELMKSISSVEFLYKDRKVLKDRINFTYPEKYKSFVIYDDLLKQDQNPILMTQTILAMTPKKQLEYCKQEERRLLSEIFTLKNVLNIVDENKALEIRVQEIQKMVDILMTEKKSLQARVQEMLGNKAQSEQKKVDEEGIIFSDYKGKLEIKGGNTDKLIERLYNKNIIGSVSEYVDTFLITYRSFTTSKKVMEMLIKTYDEHAYIDVEGETERQFQIEQENLTKKKIRLRIVNFLKRWAELFFHDFDADLIQEYNQFTANCGDDHLSSLLQKSLAKKLNVNVNGSGTLSTTKSPTFNKNAPSSLVPKTPVISLDDVDPVEIARQLTIVEFDLYRSIASKELLSLSWQKSDKEKRSPNLLKMIYRFNEISNWVTATIVKETNLKKRAFHIKRFIKLTEELRKLNNFNCVFVVVSALYSASVNRLQKTWNEISKQQMKSFEEVVALTSPNSSFCAYREELHKANPPCIPYLGVHLSDLTFIEEGNPDKLENGYVNFFKCRMVAEVIKEIQQYQQQPYNLLPVPEIANLLASHKVITENDCFKLSLTAEPRESISS